MKRRLRLTDHFMVAGLLGALVACGAALPEPEAVKAGILEVFQRVTEARDSELLAQAQSFLSQSKYADCCERLRQYLEMVPSDTEVRSLLQQIEALIQ